MHVDISEEENENLVDIPEGRKVLVFGKYVLTEFCSLDLSDHRYFAFLARTETPIRSGEIPDVLYAEGEINSEYLSVRNSEEVLAIRDERNKTYHFTLYADEPELDIIYFVQDPARGPSDCNEELVTIILYCA